MGFILFTAIFLAGIIPINELVSAYNPKIGSDFNNSLNQLSSVTNLTSSMSLSLQEGTLEGENFFDRLLVLSTTSIKLLFNMPSIMFAVIQEISINLGLPNWVFPITLLLILVSLIFVVLGYFTKKGADDNR